MDVYPQWVIDPVKRYWGLTDKEARQQIDAYMMTDQGRQELRGVLMKCSVDPKLIRKFGTINMNTAEAEVPLAEVPEEFEQSGDPLDLVRLHLD